jgi:hypothetical protein
MADEVKELQGIDWRRTFAFLEILRSFRLAANPFKIVLCLLGLAASLGIGVMVDQIPGVGQTNVHVTGVIPIEFRLANMGLDLNSRTSFYDNMHYILTKTLWGQWAIPYVDGRGWSDFSAFVAAPANAAWQCVSLAMGYWQQSPLFALITTILMLAVWAFVGGAVTRMTAVRVAREESLPLKSVIRFACVKWPSTATCVLIPFGVLVVVGIIAYLPAGGLLAIPYVGEYVVGLALPLSLLMGLICAMVFMGGTFSLGLQWPTIAAEGSDSFDAISRSISYISSRPWRYIFYSLFSAAYGCLTFVFVKFLTFLTLFITHKGIAVFWTAFTLGKGEGENKIIRLWAEPTLANPWRVMGGAEQFGAEGAAQPLFEFWIWIVMALLAAFLISFFFTSQTIIYFLMRKVVDATDIEEVYMEESDEDLPLERKAENPQIVKADAAPAAPGEDKPAEPPKA